MYRIVRDDAELLRFIDWLPETRTDETFYICLMARRKYHAALPSASTQLARIVVGKAGMYHAIRRLECPLGCYRVGHEEVPEDALALYVSPNPRDLRVAAYDTIAALSTTLKNGGRLAPHDEAVTCIQRAARRRYVCFDYDGVDADADAVAREVPGDALTIVDTRGGFHALVEPARLDPAQRDFYQRLRALPGLDQAGDLLLPVPGTTQGGVVPRMRAPPTPSGP